MRMHFNDEITISETIARRILAAKARIHAARADKETLKRDRAYLAAGDMTIERARDAGYIL